MRALTRTVVFCLAAAVGGGARAAEVYPGCAVPPTTFNHVWYIDPVNGKTPADGGNGSRTAPWNSLQGVVGSTKQSGYNYPMLSTVTYDHYPQKNAQGARFYADGPSSDPTRVQPGDEILLMGGQYGDISIGAWAAPTTNSAFVTIAAAPGQTPVLSMLGLTASSYFVFSGIKVQSMADGSETHRVSRFGRRSGLRSANLEYRIHKHARLISRRHVRLDESTVVGAGPLRWDWHQGQRHDLRLGDKLAHFERHIWRGHHDEHYAVLRQ